MREKISFLERLRRQPESYKTRISFLGALFLTLIIIVFWMTSTFPDFTRKKISNTASVIQAPIEVIKNKAEDSFGEIKKQFSIIKDSLSGIAEYTSTTTQDENITVKDEIPSSTGINEEFNISN